MSALSRLSWQAFATSSLLLAGCQEKPKDDSYLIAQLTEMRQRIAKLEQENADMKRDLKSTNAYLGFVGKQQGETLKLVSSNAKIANENAVRDMTRRGACGYDYDPATRIYTARTCKHSDLSP